jgi:hypothetical protein
MWAMAGTEDMPAKSSAYLSAFFIIDPFKYSILKKDE